MKFNILVFIFFVLSFSAWARTTRTANTSGSWSTAANWSPASVPASNQTNNQDDLEINIGNGKITLTGDFSLKTGTTLRIYGCDTLLITGNATFANGGVLQVDPCAVLIIQGNLTNNNNSNEINIDGGLTVGGNFNGGNGSVIAGTGNVDILGTITLSGTGGITAIVLPVDLIQFSAIFNGDRVNISWSTATELNNDRFIIERSKDGFEWQEIITTSGAGNSTSVVEYFESDYNPLPGVSYYRLKQVDFDGKSQTFNVVPVENNISGKTAFTIFPNPTNAENINLSFSGFENQEFLVVLRDIQGREYFSKVTFVSSDDEIQILRSEQELPNGLYLITASSYNQLYSQKVIIK
jgi:hypothetical protein